MNDFNINNKHIIYVIIVITLFFIIPFIWVGKKIEILKKFSLKNLLSVLNISFQYQIIVCIVGLLMTFIMQKIFYISQIGLDLMFVEIIYCFTLILIIYLPIIGILNFIRFVKQRNILKSFN